MGHARFHDGKSLKFDVIHLTISYRPTTSPTVLLNFLYRLCYIQNATFSIYLTNIIVIVNVVHEYNNKTAIIDVLNFKH